MLFPNKDQEFYLSYSWPGLVPPPEMESSTEIFRHHASQRKLTETDSDILQYYLPETGSAGKTLLIYLAQNNKKRAFGVGIE